MHVYSISWLFEPDYFDASVLLLVLFLLLR